MPPRADVLRDGESRTGAVNINPRCGVETEHGRSIWTESVKPAILSEK